MIKQALTHLQEPRTYGIATMALSFCGIVYLLGNNPVAPMLDWAAAGTLFILSLLYFVRPSVFDFGEEPKRPSIQYLISEGFINLLPNEDDFSHTVRVDSSKCPWKVEVTYLSSYTEIHFADDPVHAYVFDNKIIDRT